MLTINTLISITGTLSIAAIVLIPAAIVLRLIFIAYKNYA
jgi:hypothetical protein